MRTFMPAVPSLLTDTHTLGVLKEGWSLPPAHPRCRFLVHSEMEISNSWNHVTLWQELLHFCLVYIRTERSHKENERFPALR